MSDEKKVNTTQAVLGVRGIIKLTVNGEGEVVFGELESVNVGFFGDASKPDAQMQEWTEKHVPLVVGWFVKLILAGAAEAAREYAVAQSQAEKPGAQE